MPGFKLTDKPVSDLNSRISSEFGKRIHPTRGRKHRHSGIDIAVPIFPINFFRSYIKKSFLILFFSILSINDVNAQDIGKTKISSSISNQNSNVSSSNTKSQLISKITNPYTIAKIKKFREQYPIDWFYKRFGRYSDCENPWSCGLHVNSEEEYKKAKCAEQEPFKSEEEYQQKCELKGAKFTEEEIKSLLVAVTYIFDRNSFVGASVEKENSYDGRIAEYVISIYENMKKNPNIILYKNLRDFLYSSEYLLSSVVLDSTYLYAPKKYFVEGEF